MDGVILKALSGFYYVSDGGEGTVACRARGKFRHLGLTPLVGDRVRITRLEDGTGMVDEVLPRRNWFERPAVANIDRLVIVASGAVPATDPFLIDRVAAIAESRGCESVICINKCDLDRADGLFSIYRTAGFPTIRVSAVTGEGVAELGALISGTVCAFTGNSGVGKSSLLNALQPDFRLRVGEVSEKLGRGRHTTRHVELFRVGDALVADTPGFSSMEADRVTLGDKGSLGESFREFRPYLDHCRFVGCSHTKETGCAVLEAVRKGIIPQSRHDSYVRLYQEAKERHPWEEKQEQ